MPLKSRYSSKKVNYLKFFKAMKFVFKNYSSVVILNLLTRIKDSRFTILLSFKKHGFEPIKLCGKKFTSYQKDLRRLYFEERHFRNEIQSLL